MAILPISTARVSNLLRTSLAQSQIARTQGDLVRTQNELSTGRRLNVASDDPGDAAVVQQLQKTLEQRQTYLTNLGRAQSGLSEVDSTMGDLGDLLNQAKTIASANVGSDVTADARLGAAAVVEKIYDQAVSLANREFEGVYLFGGDRSTEEPFVSEAGGVKFVGSSTVLKNRYDENTDLPFMVDGAALFGALSTRVEGVTDLTPSIGAATRLSDLRGASGDGVRPGLIKIGNGSATATVDLSQADSTGDVVDAINAAGLGTVTASIAPDGVSLKLSGGATEDITVDEVGGGTTAADLGILQTTGGGAGVALDGADVKARVTNLTPLASLNGGAGIDLASGIQITNGQTNATINFTGATTVQDLLNKINNSGTHVRAEINAAGTGINILNPVQGVEMRLGENGGTTAADLGIRSYGPTTSLADLNDGKGVRTVAGADMTITASNGTSFNVDLSAAQTDVQGVIGAINAAATAAGVNVVADFVTTGNGIRLADNTGGGGAFTIGAANYSYAAADLGFSTGAVGNVITASDVAPVRAQGLLADLGKLRDSLQGNDQSGITAAAEGLTSDFDRVSRMRGETGARVQEMEARQARIEDQNVATQGLLSSLSDTDFTKTIAEFQTLQTALQATMQTSAKVLNLSLMDFIG
jgi:flagellin-like hook-associated protein FlgL